MITSSVDYKISIVHPVTRQIQPKFSHQIPASITSGLLWFYNKIRHLYYLENFINNVLIGRFLWEYFCTFQPHPTTVLCFIWEGLGSRKSSYYFKPTLMYYYDSQDQWNLLQVYVLPPMIILAKIFIHSVLSCFNVHDDKKIIWDHFLKKKAKLGSFLLTNYGFFCSLSPNCLVNSFDYWL